MPAIIDGTNGVTTPNVLTSSSGVALTLQSAGTTAVTIDTSQNVGIGTTSPSSKARLTVSGTTGSGTGGGILITGSGYQTSPTGMVLGQYDATTFYIQRPASSSFEIWDSASNMQTKVDSSGNLLVGTTSLTAGNAKLTAKADGSGNSAISANSPGTTAYNVISIENGNGQVGRIQTNASATSYLTSSDYRLKEDVQPMVGALAKVQALKPCTFKWKVDATNGQGFIAHELQEVCPDAVGGAKDAVDANGNPVYQGIDTSFLVATLTAAIQELKALVDAQATEIAELKAKVG